MQNFSEPRTGLQVRFSKNPNFEPDFRSSSQKFGSNFSSEPNFGNTNCYSRKAKDLKRKREKGDGKGKGKKKKNKEEMNMGEEVEEDEEEHITFSVQVNNSLDIPQDVAEDGQYFNFEHDVTNYDKIDPRLIYYVFLFYFYFLSKFIVC